MSERWKPGVLKRNRSAITVPVRDDAPPNPDRLDPHDVRCRHNVYWKRCTICSKTVKP